MLRSRVAFVPYVYLLSSKPDLTFIMNELCLDSDENQQQLFCYDEFIFRDFVRLKGFINYTNGSLLKRKKPRRIFSYSFC